jgi:hypothetical protein
MGIGVSQGIVNPGKLPSIGEMLRKWDQVEFTVNFYYLSPLHKYGRVIIYTVVTYRVYRGVSSAVIVPNNKGDIPFP